MIIGARRQTRNVGVGDRSELLTVGERGSDVIAIFGLK